MKARKIRLKAKFYFKLKSNDFNDNSERKKGKTFEVLKR